MKENSNIKIPFTEPTFTGWNSLLTTNQHGSMSSSSSLVPFHLWKGRGLYPYFALVPSKLMSSPLFKFIRNNPLSIVIKDCPNHDDGWMTTKLVAGCRAL